MAGHWRDSARQAMLGPLDARSCFPFLIFFLHISLTTFLISLFTVVFLTLLNRKNFTIEVFSRYILNVVLGGRRRQGVPWWLNK